MSTMAFELLAVSDEIDPRIHSATVGERMRHVSLVIGCGDLPASYLEFLADAINKPVYYVLGNHAAELTRGNGSARHPAGAVDLGFQVLRDESTGLILAGFPGSPRYGDDEPLQFTERQVYWGIARMAPRLLWNKLRHGRALDVLVTHAPPRDVNDRADVAHRGFKALRSFIEWFQPAYQLHGHVHLYDRSQPYQQHFLGTDVINVFPYRVVEIREPAPAAQPTLQPALQPAPTAVPLEPRRSLTAKRQSATGR